MRAKLIFASVLRFRRVSLVGSGVFQKAQLCALFVVLMQSFKTSSIVYFGLKYDRHRFFPQITLLHTVIKLFLCNCLVLVFMATLFFHFAGSFPLSQKCVKV